MSYTKLLQKAEVSTTKKLSSQISLYREKRQIFLDWIILSPVIKQAATLLFKNIYKTLNSIPENFSKRVGFVSIKLFRHFTAKNTFYLSILHRNIFF